MTTKPPRPSDAPPSKSHGRVSIRPSMTPSDLMASPPSVKGAWHARVVTLFPEAFPGILEQSLTGKALESGKWRLECIDLRRFGEGRHHNVDDTPAGGGAGMVLRADVVDRALCHAMGAVPKDRSVWPLIYVSPRGQPFNQALARRLSQCQGATFLCGRFEGVDQRVLDHHNVEEVSLGDFVLTGGELAVQVMLDATVRLLPEVLGNAASVQDESFSNGLLEYPQYTRPTKWNDQDIPPILLSGNHAEIAKWRHHQAQSLTQTRRPDLWERYLQNTPQKSTK